MPSDYNIFTDQTGRRYHHDLRWIADENGNGFRPHMVRVYEIETEDEEMDARVFYDNDIRRLLCWFDEETLYNGDIFDYWMCNDCGEWYNVNDDEPVTYGDDVICEKCRDDNYISCSICGELLHIDDGIQTHDEGIVCQACLDDKFAKCADCGNWFKSDEMVGDEYTSLCHSCYSENWFRCDDCRCVVHCDDMYSNDNGCYCESCFEGHRDEADEYGIHEYGYRPDMKFKGEGSLHFGTEMEMDYGSKDRFKFNELSDNFYVCHDGSLDDGMEVISHPMTYEWIMEHTPYNDVCRLAIEAGFKSHNTDTCGFHVHMSRRAFGDPWESSTNDRITSFVFFFEKFWKEIVIFSRRKHDFSVVDANVNAIDHYAKRMCDEGDTVDIATVDKKKNDKSWDRYHCVNLSNHPTIEVRIFRGTLKVNTIIASIQLCKLFFELSVFDVNAIEHMTWEQIKTYAETDYPELLKYLKERNL